MRAEKVEKEGEKEETEGRGAGGCGSCLALPTPRAEEMMSGEEG